MKKLLGVTVLITLIFVGSGTTWALPYSGTYLGTFRGDYNKVEDVESALASVGKNVDLDFYAKYDWDERKKEGPGELSLSESSFNRRNGPIRGKWSTDDVINLYSVKAGRGFALYWLDSAENSGSWSTGRVRRKGLSHISTWVINGQPGLPPSVSEVPEPSTVFLLGIGIIGIVGLGRKLKK